MTISAESPTLCLRVAIHFAPRRKTPRRKDLTLAQGSGICSTSGEKFSKV